MFILVTFLIRLFVFETFSFFSIYLFYIICYYNTFQIIELLFRLFRNEFQQSGAVSPMFFLESLPFLLLCSASASASASASVSVSVSGKKRGMRKKIPTCLFVKVCFLCETYTIVGHCLCVKFF